jgi:hypothetical protein
MLKDLGFSTANDLDRHYKSAKHREAPTRFSKRLHLPGVYRWQVEMVAQTGQLQGALQQETQGLEY